MPDRCPTVASCHPVHSASFARAACTACGVAAYVTAAACCCATVTADFSPFGCARPARTATLNKSAQVPINQRVGSVLNLPRCPKITLLCLCTEQTLYQKTTSTKEKCRGAWRHGT